MGCYSDPCMGEFAVCADNFRGQNNNCTVIWFIIFLIKTVVFPKVTLIFHVWGHTNNNLDSHFNIIKGGHHKYIYIYIFQDMVEVFNSPENFRVITMNTYQFIEYNHFSKPLC